MKALLLATLLVALASVAFSMRTATAQTPTDPEGVVRAMIDAFNRGDAATAASYMAEDATATGLCPPAGTCHGRAEFQRQLEMEIAEGAHDEIRGLTVNGDVVTVLITETAPGLAALGIERTYITVTATVRDGLVTSLTDELDLSDPQTAKFAQALAQLEQTDLPAAGTGYTTNGRSSGTTFAILALIFAGSLLLTVGGRLRTPGKR